MKQNKRNWAKGLSYALDNPDLKLINSDQAAVIKDKYPKSENHFLVLPLVNIPSIYHLNRNHLPLLVELELLAENAIEISGKLKDKFKIGYHLSPSMERLHLHVISTDFNSKYLKTKIHWNSFNTNFFLSPKDVYETVKNYGKLEKPSQEEIKKLLATILKCNQCDYMPQNMPYLKRHLTQHKEENKNNENKLSVF